MASLTCEAMAEARVGVTAAVRQVATYPAGAPKPVPTAAIIMSGPCRRAWSAFPNVAGAVVRIPW